MTNDDPPTGPVRRAVAWATTPPQAYGVYLAAVVLVFLLSFYAGALKPKKIPDAPAAPISAPRS